MQHARKFVFLVFVLFFLSLSLTYANNMGFFSLDWNYQASYQVSPNALDSIGQTVYYGSGNPNNPTNLLYARDISSGNLIWQYNTSLPVNYVSHFSPNGSIYVITGTGGSQTSGLVSKSYVIARSSSNETLWQSTNLSSSVRSLCSAKNYTGNGEDVVAGLLNGTLLRLSGVNGSILWRQSCVGEVFTISELKNGSIVVGSRESATNVGHVYRFQKNGALEWEMPPLPLQPAITLVRKFADVNLDGEPEMIAVFNDNEIHVLNGSNGQELTPKWPLSLGQDNIKDLLCRVDYTGDGFPDIVAGTEDGNLTIINGLTAAFFVVPTRVSYTLSHIQYMYYYKDETAYLNKTLAVSVIELPGPSFAYYINGVNASNMATMKQYQTSAPTSNLNNIGNFTSSYTGDLIFSVNDFIHLPATFSVYCISGTEIIVSEFPSPIILAILIAAAWLLMAILRRKHFGIE